MKVDGYLDTVVRLDGAVGFIVAPHPQLAIWCVKWSDNGDPQWASPDLIRHWMPGSGIDRQMLIDARTKLCDEIDLHMLNYDPLDYIH